MEQQIVLTVAQALTKNAESELKTSSKNLAIAKTLASKFGSEDDFLITITPDMQLAMASNEHQCFFSDRYPTLIELNLGYSWNTAVKWLSVQLFDLNEYCGCKEKMTNRQLEQCANIIVHGYGWLKVSEMMLFLVRFKQARYGRFYGAIDPMIILSALKDFVRERQDAYFHYEQEGRERKAAEEATQSITWEEFRRTHPDHIHDFNPLYRRESAL